MRGTDEKLCRICNRRTNYNEPLNLKELNDTDLILKYNIKIASFNENLCSSSHTQFFTCFTSIFFFLLGRKQKIWDRAAHDSHSIRSEVEADVLATYNASLTCNTKLYLQKAIS